MLKLCAFRYRVRKNSNYSGIKRNNVTFQFVLRYPLDTQKTLFLLKVIFSLLFVNVLRACSAGYRAYLYFICIELACLVSVAVLGDFFVFAPTE